MKRLLLIVFLMLLCFILQSTLFQAIAFNGIVPNLLIILTASFGFMRGEYVGMLAGFACGLLYDVMYGDVIGFHALLLLYIGFCNGFFAEIFYPEDLKLPLILIFLSDITYGILCYICLFMLQGKLHFGFYFTRVIVPEVIYTIIVSILVYPLVLFLDLAIEKSFKKRSLEN